MRITPLSALLLAISLCTTAATAETPRAAELMGVGPNPTLPKPEKSLMPTVHTAKAVGWPANGKPQPAQGLAVTRQLGLPDDAEHVNPNGGAIALGHPLGCTGARMTTTLLYEMRRRSARYGLVTMCVGGGMGAAGIFERM